MTRCFDFPEVVIHDGSGECGRYQEGGICHPEPRPNPAVTEEEIRAVKTYHEFRKVLAGKPGDFDRLEPVKAKGQAVDPATGEVIESMPFEEAVFRSTGIIVNLEDYRQKKPDA